jgi:4'-phosphopantetheinyl transferase
MTRIYYLFPGNDFADIDFHSYLRLLPAFEQRKLMAFRERSDLCLSLYGKLMLIQSFRDFNLPFTDLASMVLSEFRKPVLPATPPLHFSISHCRTSIVVAVSNEYEIGIDIEKIEPIDLSLYQHVFHPGIFERIENSENSSTDFYRYWTCYEAALKAHGKGFLIDLKGVCLLNKTVIVENTCWYTQTVELHKDYICFLATSCPHINVPITNIDPVSFPALLI